MQPSFYYTPTSKAATYMPPHKNEHHSIGNYQPNFSPVSPKNAFEPHKIQQRLHSYNNSANNIKHPPPYLASELKHYKQQNFIPSIRPAGQKFLPNNIQTQIPYSRYGEMKNSYMGPDARQIAHTKQVFIQQIKNAKKLPRVSQPNLFYQPDSHESSQKTDDSFQDITLSKKRISQDVNNKAGVTISTANSPSFVPSSKLDAQTRYRMRKSSFDPTQSWKQSASLKKKVEKKLSLNDFQKIEQLGTGKYGKVFLVREKATLFVCALKIIEKQMLKQQQITEQFIRQLKIQLFLNHPNIVKMYGYFQDQTNIYIILQVALGGQLFKQIKRGVPMPEQKVAPIMRQVCSAVNELHSNQIIHRDIKPQNIVLHENIIKLCDFGWSVYHGQTLRNTFCGTPLYVSPQILKGNDYDEKIDIWSLGIMMYEMLVGQNPFKITQQQQLVKIIRDTVIFPSYITVSNEAKDFVLSCLQKNPSERVSIRQLVNHDFFKKYPEKGLDRKMAAE